MDPARDKQFLELAMELSGQSVEPVPCAAVLVAQDGQIIAKEYNSQRTDGAVASHAEMKAIAVANRQLGRKLTGVTAYGNCEPCTMCLTALIFSGVDRIVFLKRLNDYVSPERKINIDCFEFVERFPNPPKIEQISLT